MRGGLLLLMKYVHLSLHTALTLTDSIRYLLEPLPRIFKMQRGGYPMSDPFLVQWNIS